MIALTGIKVGDRIACEVRFSSSVEIHSVERLTATTAVCKRATFKLDSGLMVGTGGSSGGWGRRHGRVATEADITRSRVQSAQRRIASVKVDAQNLDAIEALLDSIAAQSTGTPP